MRGIEFFNVKPDVWRENYEDWAWEIDKPAVRSLRSGSRCEVLEERRFLGCHAVLVYFYVKIINVSDPNGFAGDVGSEIIQAVAAEFLNFADNPQFMAQECISALMITKPKCAPEDRRAGPGYQRIPLAVSFLFSSNANYLAAETLNVLGGEEYH
jgi:hypothetical protein